MIEIKSEKNVPLAFLPVDHLKSDKLQHQWSCKFIKIDIGRDGIKIELEIFCPNSFACFGFLYFHFLLTIEVSLKTICEHTILLV